MFNPKRIIFEKGTLDTDVGKKIYNKFRDNKDVEIINISSNRIKEHIPGENLYEQYRSGKQTMVVGIRKSLKFQTCKPSANYQLPLVSGCMGRCEYCYLNTQLGDKPFIRVFVNVDEILEQTKKYIEDRKPQVTIFEGAATSDPVPVEPYTNSLKKTIEFLEERKKEDLDLLLNTVMWIAYWMLNIIIIQKYDLVSILLEL
ncbi:spore photoproduct lyase family protein [Clostridioides difficile]